MAPSPETGGNVIERSKDTLIKHTMLSSGRVRQALADEGPPPPLFAALLQGAAALRREKGVDFVSGGPQHAGRLGILTFEGLSEKK